MARSTNIHAPQQHTQPSRKGKRAWRKNVDITETEAGLERAREEITRGGVIKEKPSEQLFILDTTGSESIKRTHKVGKPLKADEILALRSAVPAVDTRKRSGVTDGVIEPQSKRQKGNGVTRQEYERLRKRAYGFDAVPKDVIATGHTATLDLWDETPEPNDETLSYLEKQRQPKAPNTMRHAPICLLEGRRAMPAVTKPKAGTSYNPSFQDWDQMLTKAGERELEAEQIRIKDAQEEARKQALIEAAQNEHDDIHTEDESAWEGFESEYEGAEWLKKKRPERKTPAERNRVKRRKAAEQETRHKAKMRQGAEQAKRLGEIIKEMKAKPQTKPLVKSSSDSSSDEYDEDALRRRSFGKTRLPQKDLELVLPDELQDSLRLLKPEGNLLKDRFRSVMVRGKVETRKPVFQSKKPKRTLTEKWTYKDFTISN